MAPESVAAPVRIRHSPVRRSVTPFYFGDSSRPLAGWWHEPPSAGADVAVLLCSAQGRDEASTHRTLLHIAEQAAAAGLHAMRFDYAGCGDSAGDESMPELFAAWVQSVEFAVDELRRLSGCQRIAIVGLRLGALLATLVAARRGGIDSLVAIAPVVSGRGYVRELRALRAAGVAPQSMSADGSLESGGFTLKAATLADISAIDLRQLAAPPAPDLLILDRDDLPSARPWAKHLSSLGVRVGLQAFSGFAETMQSPQESKVPAGLADTIVGWLARAAGQQPEVARSGVAGRRDMSLGAIAEQLVSVPVDGIDLFAVATLPAHRPRSGLGVLLVNAGGQRHTGPGRLYVEMARHWGALGAVVMRLDLSGLGESPPRRGAAENVVYSRFAGEEIASAVRRLRDVYAVRRCHVVGLCSGAYHAMQAPAQGALIDGIVAINPLTFFWPHDASLDAAPPQREVASDIARYRSGLFAADRWRKVMRGEIDLQLVGRLLLRRALSDLSGVWREIARMLHRPIRDDLALELQRHAEAGIVTRFVIAQGDPGEYLLRSQGGRAVDRLLRRRAIAIDRIPEADHTFRNSRGRANLMALLQEWIVADSATGVADS